LLVFLGVNGFGGVLNAFPIPRMKRSSAPGSSSTFNLGFLAMPQPISHYTNDPKLLGGTEALDLYPDLAAQIASIVTAWSEVENSLALLLIMLIGAGSDAAIAMYESLSGSTAKEAALRAAAEHALDDERLKLFFATTRVVKKVAKQRNRIVHGLVAHCPEIKDALVIMSQAAMLKHMHLLFIKQHDGTTNPTEVRAAAAAHFVKSSFVYNRQSFSRVLSRCQWANDLLMDLAVICAQVHPGKDRSLARLLSEPQIQTELSRQDRGQKTPPEEQ
jgi:hypothetical protein